ncbi:MAG TPA: alpha-amylase family protein, partial [Planctomycetota bacterium]|nr:alpha-amylase family protein [Planctomycetota bacterium]
MVALRRLMLVPAVLLLSTGVLCAQITKELTKENELVLSTPAWKLVFNGERGGELNQVLLFDGDRFHRVNSTFAFKSLDTIPALSFTNTKDSYYSGKWDIYYANEGRKCEFKVLKETPGEIHFRVSNRPRVMENGKEGPFVVTYTWHVYDVGVVFCDFEIALPTKEDIFELAWSLMGMHVEDYMFKEKHQGKVSKFVWNYGLLDQTTEGGRWGAPVMSSTKAQPLDIDFSRDTQPRLLGFVPYGSATFNLDHLADTSYTNAMEIVWETAKALVGDDLEDFGTHFKFRQSGLSPPPTWMGSDRNPPTFSFEWNLYHGANVDLEGPFKYENRFGMGFTVQRTTGNAAAHPVLKNRLQGARIYHWVNAAKNGAAWYPSTDDVAKMSAAGADVLILGEGWRTPGTYKSASADDLKRVVEAAHERNMRVALTLRGEDYYVLERDTSWFTDVLKRDFDGIYVIHPGFLYTPTNANAFPVKIAGEDVTARMPDRNHVDAYANFLWSKKLRNLVGPDGFLIGETHPLLPTRIGLAYFDAYAPDIAGLSGTMDSSVYVRFRTGNGC